MKKFLIIQSIFFLTFCLAYKSSAGGPVSVVDGMAVVLNNDSFTYRYDSGKLGNLNNKEAIELVESALNIWREIKTSKLKIQQDAKQFIDYDINKLNFEKTIANAIKNNYSLVVFDNDGSILKSLKQTSNIAGAGILIDQDEFIPELKLLKAKTSIIVLNGLYLNGVKTKLDPEASIEDFKSVIIHELGHAFGLDHSQINIEALNDKTIPVPAMFPVANNANGITIDDIASISLLYPDEEELKKLGTIKGSVVTEEGKPILGTNVVAREITNPKVQAVSCVSDYLEKEDGSFILNALPPGKYRIEIEPIEPLFVAGSRVGPYTNNISDESFQFVSSKSFYSSLEMPTSKDEDKAQIFEIKEGDSITGINIITPFEKEIEPNNTKNEAQEIFIPGTVKGQISRLESGDQRINVLDGFEFTPIIEIKDYFKFQVSEHTIARIVVSPIKKEEPGVVSFFSGVSFYLFDKEGRVLDFFTPNNINIKSSLKDLPNKRIIQEILPKGEYILGVASEQLDPNFVEGRENIAISNYKIGISLSNATEDIKKSKKLVLTPPDKITLNREMIDTPILNVSAENFAKATTCKIRSKNKNIRFEPGRFLLDVGEQSKKVKVVTSSVSKLKAELKENIAIILVEVECANGVREDAGIIISN